MNSNLLKSNVTSCQKPLSDCLKETSVKNIVLNLLEGCKEISKDELINISDSQFLNSSFKLAFQKDKLKGFAVSESKFYIFYLGVFLRFQVDDICKRVTIYISNDFDLKKSKFSELINLITLKIEVYCNQSFSQVLKHLKNNDFFIELKRKERFLNFDKFEDEIVVSHEVKKYDD